MAELFVVSIHIGNWKDVTFRAIEVLKEVDYIICEEFKNARRFLSHFDIKKDLKSLNEHNEKENENKILQDVLINNRKVALISDAGSPLFADPGNRFVWMCNKNNVKVHAVPGASSIIAALMASGVVEDKFIYYGFLPANKFERNKEVLQLKKYKDFDIVLLEAPYRLKQLIMSLKKKLGEVRKAVVAYKLTMEQEKIFWGNLKEMEIMTECLPKGEFVFILRKEK